MPIAQLKRVQAYPDSTGTLHTTIEAWQKAELAALYGQAQIVRTEGMNEGELFASLVLASKDNVLAILTTGPRSRPSTRKRAGTTNPRRATKQQAAAGFKAMREAVSEVPATQSNEEHNNDVLARMGGAR